MNRLWRDRGVWMMVTLLTFLLFVTTRKAGIWSAEFLWSAVIMVAVAAVVLMIHVLARGERPSIRLRSGQSVMIVRRVTHAGNHSAPLRQ